MGFQFYETVRGKHFYEHQIPSLIKAITRLADAAEKIASNRENSELPHKNGCSYALKSIEKIQREYDESIINLALAHIIAFGQSIIRREGENRDSRSVSNSNGTSIISNAVQQDMLRCADDLACTRLDELIRYIKLSYPQSDLVVQEGKILCYKANATDDDILYVKVSSDTTDDDLDQAAALVQQETEAYAKSHNEDFSEFDVRQVVEDALKTCGIKAKPIDCYKTFYL